MVARKPDPEALGQNFVPFPIRILLHFFSLQKQAKTVACGRNMRFILCLFLSALSYTNPAFAFSDSGIYGPKYAEMLRYFSTLPQKYPGLVTVETFGTTPKGRPLIVAQIGVKSIQAKLLRSHAVAPAILISGATHGDEYLNIEDRLPEWFLSVGMKDQAIIPFFKAGGTIYVVPIMNPDGYDARTRENSKGVDLNRDFSVAQARFTGFTQVETRAVRDMVAMKLRQMNQELMVSMDYHCCIGAALYPWSFKPAPAVAPSDLNRFLKAAAIIKQTFGANFPVGRTPDILGYSAIGTTKDYYYENYGTVSFTYEGKEEIEKNRFPEHTQMWRGLIQGIMTGAFNRSFR